MVKHREAMVELLRRAPLALGWFRLDRFRLSRRTDALWLAMHQLALRGPRYVRLPEGQLLELPVVVDAAARPAPSAPLELAGTGGTGDRRARPLERRRGGAVPGRT